MRGKLRNIWENTLASLWFVPSVLVIAAVLLAALFLAIDQRFSGQESILSSFVVASSADAARLLLSVIAGSLVTAISIVYSIVVVALQQMSAQFTPRVLRMFTADRINQVVLGAFVGTFIYALLVLLAIRTPTADPALSFVPALSLSVALGLALLCIGLLVYFIHHMSQTLQVAVIMDRIHDDLIEQIEILFPHEEGEITDLPPAAASGASLERGAMPSYVYAKYPGFIRSIDEESLLDLPIDGVGWIRIRPQVGEFIPTGAILAELGADVDGTDDEVQTRIQDAFVVDRERSMYQDPLFGIRQLVDIGLKALSPAINDMTTAEYALSQLGDTLGRLAVRSFPFNQRTATTGHLRVIFNRPTWGDFVDTAFSQIRRQAAGDVHVTSTLLRVLYHLAIQIPAGERVYAVQQQIAEIRSTVAARSFSPADQANLQQQIEEIEQVLLPKRPISGRSK
jgi:uncharacterized membrane protein